MPIYTVKLGPIKGEGGKVFNDGDRLELPPETAQPLLGLGVIEIVEGTSIPEIIPSKAIRKPIE